MAAGLLLLLMKALITDKRLYEAPEGTEPPPFWIRGLLIFTCTAVSFAHGSNDGQKGMGLIMLILIGLVPTAYALNRAVPQSATADFVAVSAQTVAVLDQHVSKAAVLAGRSARRRARHISGARTSRPIRCWRCGRSSMTSPTSLRMYKAMANVPPQYARNFRNDMYLTSEAFRLMKKQDNPAFTAVGLGGARQLQEAYRSRDQVYSRLGESRGRDGAGHWARWSAGSESS